MPIVTFSNRLNTLRFQFGLAYRQSVAITQKPTQPLHLLLSIPIHERLILLALIDGVSPQEIKKTLHADNDDLALKSPRMKTAIKRLQGARLDPYAYWPEQYTREEISPDTDLTNGHWDADITGIAWERRWGPRVEPTLRQLLFADVAVCLFGEAVPPSLVGLSLVEKLAIYCLMVEELDWQQTQELLGCTQWRIKAALAKTKAAIGGL